MLPLAAYIREETLAALRRLVDVARRKRPVIPHGGGRQERGGVVAELSHGTGQGAGRGDPRPEQSAAVRPRPRKASDARAAEADHGASAGEHLGIERARVREPFHLVGSRGGATHEADDFMAVGAQVVDERSPDQSARAPDDDATR